MATYTIIGGDQKPYPFVTEESVRAWIAEGRLGEQSLIKVDGGAEFRPLAEFPEFADALAAKAAPAAEAPARAGAGIAPPRTSGLAITSLALGILGLFTCGITAVIGLVLGIVALVKIRNSQGALKGGGLALAGIIVSTVFVLLIPIFAGVFLPGLAQAKKRAEMIRCQNNVRQLSLALRQYADGHQNQFPAATNWCDALQLYVGTAAYNCPLDAAGGRCSYALNLEVAGLEPARVAPDTVIIYESVSGWNLAGGPGLMPARARHGRMTVVGFADGHVEAVEATRLPQLRWNP